jgi:hypothetical protein
VKTLTEERCIDFVGSKQACTRIESEIVSSRSCLTAVQLLRSVGTGNGISAITVHRGSSEPASLPLVDFIICESNVQLKPIGRLDDVHQKSSEYQRQANTQPFVPLVLALIPKKEAWKKVGRNEAYGTAS